MNDKKIASDLLKATPLPTYEELRAASNREGGDTVAGQLLGRMASDYAAVYYAVENAENALNAIVRRVDGERAKLQAGVASDDTWITSGAEDYAKVTARITEHASQFLTMAMIYKKLIETSR